MQLTKNTSTYDYKFGENVLTVKSRGTYFLFLIFNVY